MKFKCTHCKRDMYTTQAGYSSNPYCKLCLPERRNEFIKNRRSKNFQVKWFL